jgi:hypothetical protein
VHLQLAENSAWVILEGRSFSYAVMRSLYFCHHEPALAGEGSAFRVFSKLFSRLIGNLLIPFSV